MGRWVWLSAIAVAIGTVWYQWKDDALLPEAQRWIQQGSVVSAKGSNAFAFLMGFDAPDSDDPVQTGKFRISRALSAVQNTESDDMPGRLTLPTGDGFCRIRQQGCLDTILARGGELRSLLSEHALVLSRYQRFLQFEEFSSMVPIDAEQIVPPVSFLSTGNKLQQFEIIVKSSQQGDRDEATRMLEHNIASLRRHLGYADTLMQKVFVGSLIADNLDLAAGLYSRGLIASLDVLQPLVPEEITLEQAIRREFASHVHRFSEFAAKGLPNSDAEGPPSQFVFKKNRSVNTLYQELRQLLIRSSLPAALVDDAFVAHRKKQKKNALYSLSNPVGSIVVKTVVNLEPVVFRLRDLDCKLKLLSIRMQVSSNTRSDLLTELPDSVDISNPYEPEKLLAFDAEQQTMCFDGPASQRPDARCITL